MRQKEFLMLCARGSREEIEEAIENGAKINKKARVYGVNVPPIFVAVTEENFDAIEVLLEHGATSAEAFTAAIIKGKRRLLKFLVDCGADVNQTKSKSIKPLILAVTANNPKVVKWLIELGADVNLTTEVGYNALAYLALMQADKPIVRTKNTQKIVTTLMNHGSNYDEAMIVAVKSGNVPFLESMFESGANPNRKCKVSGTERSISPLAAAMFVGGEEGMDFTTVKTLAEFGADVNELFELGDDTVTTPLNIVVAENRTDIATIITAWGADPDYQDSSGRTPLAYSVMTGAEMLGILLEYTANPNIADKNGRTPLMLAALDVGYEPEVMELLVEYGADVNVQDNDGMTALMWTIATRDRTPLFLISGLIRTGGMMAEVAETCVILATVYTYMKREAQLSAVKFLLEHGADTKIRDKTGMNAMMCAMMNNDNEIVDILLEHSKSESEKED